MTARAPDLQTFIGAAQAAYQTHAQSDEARVSIKRVFDALDTPARASAKAPETLAVTQHLAGALTLAKNGATSPQLKAFLAGFESLQSKLSWRRRIGNETASANFTDGHANAMIIGPGGLEERTDAWLGVSLLAPHVRYPDHTHAPEEVYLVASDGAFFQDGRGWFTPGIGGSFYNRPGIVHAMRSEATPLFAFWILYQT